MYYNCAKAILKDYVGLVTNLAVTFNSLNACNPDATEQDIFRYMIDCWMLLTTLIVDGY